MSSYEVKRSATIDADSAHVHDLVDDFHRWTTWSPWEDLDPGLERTYSGPASGVGSSYAWKGNRKAGEGSMEITGSTPDQVDIDLRFVKPFRNTAAVRFELVPSGSGTEVTWRMSGENRGVWGLVSRLTNMTERFVGKDFDKGLARLKAVAEAR